MTIELAKITKKVRMGPIRATYTDLNIVVPTGVNMALLGRKQAGLDAIVDLILGADAPDKGTITRTESISWPIPSAGFVAKHISMAANARFLARLYETDEEVFLARVVELGQLKDVVNLRVDMCPTEQRSLFCFLVGICLPFDRYILTSMSAGPKSERGRVVEMVESLMERANILLVGQDVKNAQQYCTQAYVFDEGKATFYDDMEAAAEHFNSIESKDVDEDDFLGADTELEDLVNVDF